MQVLLLLEVNPTDKQPYKTVLECKVPPEQVPHAGQSLAIEFDPRDPKRVILAREGNEWRSASGV
jgi:hypothetical protein